MSTPSNPPNNNGNAITFVGANLTYVPVAASSSDSTLGPTGATGDYLNGVLVIPATTAAGSISIKDGGGSAISIFVTGTLSSLVPFFIPLGCTSQVGKWTITTGADVSVIVTGRFT